MNDLKGKVVLITGAARGIGRGIALRLAREGSHLLLVDINIDELKKVKKEIDNLNCKAEIFISDISQRNEVYNAVAYATEKLGGFDVMINNAGISQVKKIADVLPEDFHRILDINVGGVIWGIQAAAEQFKKLNIKGKIINAASIAAYDGAPMLGVYSATKFSVRALTQVAAKEYASFGITVNAYCPGIVETDMWIDIDKSFSEMTGTPRGATYHKFIDDIALGRVQTPDDVAALVAFLSSKDSDYITGQSIITDGGIIYR